MAIAVFRASTPTAEVRRKQIVEAASACVRRAGFHGASIAEIAKAAGLSVGQIYRYFENKDAIIAAIVAEEAARIRDRLAEFAATGAPLAETVRRRFAEALDRNYDPARAALMLEIVAEAARNPRIGEIVRDADETERALVRTLLDPLRAAGLGESELAARVEVLSMLYEGMVVRGVQNPEGDRDAIAEVLTWLTRQLLTEPLIT